MLQISWVCVDSSLALSVPDYGSLKFLRHQLSLKCNKSLLNIFIIKSFCAQIVLPRNSSGEMAPWLWWLDEKTGRWRQLGKMRPASDSRTRRDLSGRRFYIGDIQTDKISPIINIDIPWKRCYVRVQAHGIDGKNLKPAEGITVTLIGKESAAQEQYYGYTQKTTNKNGLACIPAWCDSDVVLQAGQWLHSSIIHANPDKTNLKKLPQELETSIIESEELSSFTFTTKVTSQAGPIFSNNEINKCLDPDENLLAFKFYLKEIRRRCYVRAQTYINDQSGKSIEPDHMAIVTLIEKDNADPEKYPYGYPEGWANSFGKACIRAWCGSKVSLQAKRHSRPYTKQWFQLKPDKTTLDKLPRELETSVTLNSFTFTTKVISEMGPVFDNEYKCRFNLDDSLLAFKFYFTDIKPQPREIDDFGTRPPGHPLSWYVSDATGPNQEIKKCFVKVKIYSYQGIPVPMVSVHSFTPDGKTRYGYSVKRPTITGVTSSGLGVTNPLGGTNYSVSFACVEYRCSEKDRETFIVVKFLTNRCFISHPDLTGKFREQTEAYRKLMNITSSIDMTTAIYAPADASQGTLGLYTGPGKTAEERCRAGRVDNIAGDGNRKPTSDGYSLLTIYGCEYG